MYLNHWGLRFEPFCDASGLGFYPGNTQQEALARLSFLIEGRYRFGLLVAGSGMGKSALLRRVAVTMREPRECVTLVSCQGRTASEIARSLIRALGLGDFMSQPTAGRSAWQGVLEGISIQQAQGIATVLLLDDIHCASENPSPFLLQLVETHRLDLDRFTVVGACDPTGLRMLNPRLIEHCPLRMELEPWGLDETLGYLTVSFQRAGRKQNPFEMRAVEELYRLTLGIPRRVVRLAELCLLAGAADSLTTIDEQVVREVYRELTYECQSTGLSDCGHPFAPVASALHQAPTP